MYTASKRTFLCLFHTKLLLNILCCGISRYSVSNPNPVVSIIFDLIGYGSGISLLHPALDPDPLLHLNLYSLYCVLKSGLIWRWLLYTDLICCSPKRTLLLFNFLLGRVLGSSASRSGSGMTWGSLSWSGSGTNHSGSSTLFFMNKFCGCGEKPGSGYDWKLN